MGNSVMAQRDESQKIKFLLLLQSNLSQRIIS